MTTSEKIERLVKTINAQTDRINTHTEIILDIGKRLNEIENTKLRENQDEPTD